MKAKTLQRHFQESFKSLGRNGWMTFASISAVTVTLIIVGVFTAIMMNLNNVANRLENDVEIKVLIDIIQNEEEMKEIEGKLIATVENMPDVESLVYSTKEEELEKMISEFGDEFALYEQNNPLHNVLYVKAVNPQETANIAKAIEKLDYTYDVKYGEEKTEKLFSYLEIARNVGLVLIIGLLFTAIFLISNTIRITIIARKDEIEIMKLVGAKNSFVRIPFVLEGMWIGILGAIIPMIAISIIYVNVHKSIGPRLNGELLQLMPPSAVLYDVNIALIAISLIIGICGSFMSVRKFLKI